VSVRISLTPCWPDFASSDSAVTRIMRCAASTKRIATNLSGGGKFELGMWVREGRRDGERRRT